MRALRPRRPPPQRVRSRGNTHTTWRVVSRHRVCVGSMLNKQRTTVRGGASGGVGVVGANK